MIKLLILSITFLICVTFVPLVCADLFSGFDPSVLASLLKGQRVPLPADTKSALEKEEATPFNAPVISYKNFDKPQCQDEECEKKLLLGIGLTYPSAITRPTSNHPKELINQKQYFPYFKNRKNLQTESLDSKEINALANDIRSAVSSSQSSLVFLDAHGIKEVDNNQRRGLLIPEKNECINYSRNMTEVEKQIAVTPPNSPNYSQLINQYTQLYNDYASNFCNDRFLPIDRYESAISNNQQALIHFNSAEPISQLRSTGPIAPEYGHFSSIEFKGGSIQELTYKTNTPNKFKRLKAYTASSNYLEEFKVIKTCDNDIDKNGQIQLHEVNWQILKQVSFTQGLKAKAGQGGDSLYEWQSVPVRKDIQNKALSAERFWSNPGKYLENYKSVSNAFGFSVIFNVNNLRCPKFVLEDSPETIKLLKDSPALKSQKIQLLEVPKNDLDLSKDDVDFFGAPPKAGQVKPAVTQTPSITADKTKVKSSQTGQSSSSKSSRKDETDQVNDLPDDEESTAPVKKETIPLAKTSSGKNIPTDGIKHKYKDQMYKKFIDAYGYDQGITYGKEFENKMLEVSQKTGLSLDQISTLAYRESGFDPKKPNNGHGYYGLFQFGADAAQDLGTTINKVRKMSPAEQLDLYVRYQDQQRRGGEYRYSTHVLPITRFWNDSDIVGVVSTSKAKTVHARHKTPVTFYRNNKGMDMNKDGIITIGEMNAWGMGS